MSVKESVLYTRVSPEFMEIFQDISAKERRSQAEVVRNAVVSTYPKEFSKCKS